MALPKSCCCCVDLEMGCFILSVLSIIGHCSIFIDTYLGYDHSPESLSQDGKQNGSNLIQSPILCENFSVVNQIMDGTIFIWRIIGVLVILALVLGVAMVCSLTLT